MNRKLDILQYVLIGATVSALLFYSWKAAVLLLTIDVLIGVARYNWRQS